MVGLIGFIVMLVLIGLRVPVAFALASVGIGGLLYLSGVQATSVLVGNTLFSYVATFTFTAVPLFLLMGELAFGAGLIARAYEAARFWLNRAPGGLAMATVTGSTLFGAASGAGISAAAAMARLTIPEMLKYGYDRRLAAGSVAASSTIAVLVPPSIILVLYGLFTSQSLGLLFLAAYIPGLLSFLSYIAVILIRTTRSPHLAPKPDVVFDKRTGLKLIGRAWGVALLFAVIAGGIYFGLASATEAAGIAALAALVLYAFSGKASIAGLWVLVRDASRVTGMVFMILVSAAIFSAFITRTRLATEIAQGAENLGLSSVTLLLLICVVLLVMGAFIDSISMMLLTLPVLLPIFEAQRVNLIWFGVLLVKLIEVGGVTPPFGINVYVVKGAIGDLIPLEDIFSGIWWFVMADLAVIALLFAFPGLVMWMPNLISG